jgi:hypothetical protein
MSEVLMGGGFGSLRERMSAPLQRQLALADAQDQREAAAKKHQRSVEAEEWRERAFQAAVNEAVENGESMQDALAGKNLGNTPSEFIAKVNAQQDFEDSMAAARQNVEFRKWQQEQTADTSANISDGEAERAKWREHHDEWEPVSAGKRQRKREIWKVVNANERLRGRDD